MAGPNGNHLAHFGRQVKKARTARGWTLPDLARETGIDHSHWSRIERGVRPPTEKIAEAADVTFPERAGWFSDYYRDSRAWAPPGFRSWAEEEDSATSLRDWAPSVISGLLQIEDYARALLAVHPGATAEVVSARLRARMERQRRLFARGIPMHFLVDQLALYRLVGSAEVMAGQCAHLARIADLPGVVIQVVPAVEIPAAESNLILADTAAYAENLVSGSVWTDEETVTALDRVFDSLRIEAWRASESAGLIRQAAELWTGENLPTATAGQTPA